MPHAPPAGSAPAATWLLESNPDKHELHAIFRRFTDFWMLELKGKLPTRKKYKTDKQQTKGLIELEEFVAKHAQAGKVYKPDGIQRQVR
jgi:hypothetical protein